MESPRCDASDGVQWCPSCNRLMCTNCENEIHSVTHVGKLYCRPCLASCASAFEYLFREFRASMSKPLKQMVTRYVGKVK